MKILYVTTISNTVNAFLIPHIKMLTKQGHKVDVAFNIVQEVDSEIIELGCKVHELEFDRSPINKQNYKAFKKLKKLIENEKYELIHTHTPVASALARLACRKFRNIKVIYTAHGFHFYKGAPLINWLIYYPIELFLAKYTNMLITINKEDYTRSKKKFKAERIEYISGVGLDTKKMGELKTNKSRKRNEICVAEDDFLILSVGELNKNKNHETVIRAIAKMNNPNIQYVICGEGPLEKHLKSLIMQLKVEKQIRLLGYRNDIGELCQVADLFVFPSFREGLSVSLMEAMACGLPVVCSDIRGNNDLINNRKGGYLVKPDDVNGFAKRINLLINDYEGRVAMSKYNLEAIKTFDISNVIINMEKQIYKGYLM